MICSFECTFCNDCSEIEKASGATPSRVDTSAGFGEGCRVRAEPHGCTPRFLPDLSRESRLRRGGTWEGAGSSRGRGSPIRGHTPLRRGGLVESDCPGVSFNSVTSLPSPPAIDTLFIPGGLNAATASKDPELVASAKRLAACAKRIACVCTGAFLAAEAGLLTGRRAATHWRFCSQFVERFHDVKLEPDKIFVQDGHVWSSAGVSAGVDLTLALIEKDHGGPLALRVARDLVVFFKRPGGSVSVQHGTVWADRRR